MSNERTALLPSDASVIQKKLRAKLFSSETLGPSQEDCSPSSPFSSLSLPVTAPHGQPSSEISSPSRNQTSTAYSRFRCAEYGLRSQTHRFLVSKTGHYAVLALVTADIFCIFTEFLVSLYRCEEFCCGKLGKNRSSTGLFMVLEATLGMIQGQDIDLSDRSSKEEYWSSIQEGLGGVGVAFSCLFMVELLASLWAFGVNEFFKSKFHAFDACVILLSFVLDVCLKGVLEEVGSIVIALRLWRVFKIIEELGAGVEERDERWEERWGDELRAMREENEALKKELQRRKRLSSAAHEDGMGS